MVSITENPSQETVSNTEQLIEVLTGVIGGVEQQVVDARNLQQNLTPLKKQAIFCLDASKHQTKSVTHIRQRGFFVPVTSVSYGQDGMYREVYTHDFLHVLNILLTLSSKVGQISQKGVTYHV